MLKLKVVSNVVLFGSPIYLFEMNIIHFFKMNIAHKLNIKM
jgi:hypothetical protein